MIKRDLVNVAINVLDYDEAIEFYTNKLGFDLVEDTPLSNIKRWVRVRPAGSDGCCLLLAKAKNEEEESRIGNQTGGRVFLFIHTSDFDEDYQNLLDNKINIIRKPQVFDYGKVAVFEDIYGNLWDLIQPVHP